MTETRRGSLTVFFFCIWSVLVSAQPSATGMDLVLPTRTPTQQELSVFKTVLSLLVTEGSACLFTGDQWKKGKSHAVNSKSLEEALRAGTAGGAAVVLIKMAPSARFIELYAVLQVMQKASVLRYTLYPASADENEFAETLKPLAPTEVLPDINKTFTSAPEQAIFRFALKAEGQADLKVFSSTGSLLASEEDFWISDALRHFENVRKAQKLPGIQVQISGDRRSGSADAIWLMSELADASIYRFRLIVN